MIQMIVSTLMRETRFAKYLFTETIYLLVSDI